MKYTCLLCPRACCVDRRAEPGYCLAQPVPRVALYQLHNGEEPCISGNRGSGTVFFSGCNLRCVFCQNHTISQAAAGMPMTARALSDVFLFLEQQGAHNINLITPSIHVPTLREAIVLARYAGLGLPIVYNTNSYERIEALQSLSGLIDIYLPDLKFVSPLLSDRYCAAADYFYFAQDAIVEMQRQCGPLTLDTAGIAQKGLLIRHLVLPGLPDETRRVIDWIAMHLGCDTAVSLMGQFTPLYRTHDYPEIDRPVPKRQYKRAVDYALSRGLERLYIQTGDSIGAHYVPEFPTDTK